MATACSNPPAGRARWTLDLLADELVKLSAHENLSRETVRRRLAENHLKPWRRKMWCIPQIDAEYVARMEHVLNLYAEHYEHRRNGTANVFVLLDANRPWRKAKVTERRTAQECRRARQADASTGASKVIRGRHRGRRLGEAAHCHLSPCHLELHNRTSSRKAYPRPVSLKRPAPRRPQRVKTSAEVLVGFRRESAFNSSCFLRWRGA